jgi:hypothetical protein
MKWLAAVAASQKSKLAVLIVTNEQYQQLCLNTFKTLCNCFERLLKVFFKHIEVK